MKQPVKYWAVLLVVGLGAGTLPLGAAELPPPELGGPRPGVDIVVGQAGTHPTEVMDILGMDVPEVLGAGPQITFEGTQPGYVYGQQAVFVITGSDRPWRINITGTAMNLQGGSPDQYIPTSRVEVRDAKKPTDWVSLSGGPRLENPAGEADMWMQIEFRILLEPGDAPGQYQGDVFLEWLLAPVGAEPPAGGSIPLELHLNLVEFFSVTSDLTLTFTAGVKGYDAGWFYSNEGRLTVTSNTDFAITFTVAPDLVGPGTSGEHQLETVLRLRQPRESETPVWETWGDLGNDESGAPDPPGNPWDYPADPGAPWPGSVQKTGGGATQGVNDIGITGGVYRNDFSDLPGEYNSTCLLTVTQVP